jgi:pyrroline-5-carboxylate reductase
MGSALLRGWIDGGQALGAIAAIEPDATQRKILKSETGLEAVADAAALPKGFRPGVVVLAVKPQLMAEVLPAYSRYAGDAVFLSIAAGTTIAKLRSLLGGAAAVVRSMPNLPAAIGRGFTVACAGPGVTAAQRDQCGMLLSAVGEVAWIEDESLMDAVTAVSGSGPAYVFLLAECLAEAGVEAGLDPKLALRLARATVAGSGALLDAAPEHPAQLRENVTSRGGTTAAALSVLMAAEGLGALLKRAVAAAAKRARELSG